MLDVLKPLVLIAGLAYAGFVALVWLFQPRLVFFPLDAVPATPASLGLAFEELAIESAGGRRISAWYVPAAGAQLTVLHCHGNAGNIGHRLDLLELLHGLGVNVLLFDYQGYGASQGSPSEENTQADARAAWDWLARAKAATPGTIVLHGQSLGGAVAARLAAELGPTNRPAGLVLESCFTSLPDLGARLYPFLPVRLIARLRYDARDALFRLDCPLLVIHSRADEIVPFELGQQLFDGYQGGPKTMLEITGDHNMGFLLSRETYVRGWAAFLASLNP